MMIVANWKAYVEDLKKAKSLFALSKRLVRTQDISIVLAPPAPLLGALSSGNSSRIAFSAQDVSASTGGPQTGESVAQTFASVKATYAIVGHSERRAIGESEAAIAAKIAHAIAHGLTPILCVGESERDADGRYLSFIRQQVSSAISSLTLKERQKVIIAYEPIWAINKSTAAAIQSTDLREMMLYLRKILSEFLPGSGALRIPILYGGSVDAANIRELAGGGGVDGFLVGHASVDPRAFRDLVKALA